MPTRARSALLFAGSIALIAVGVIAALAAPRDVWFGLLAFALIMGGIAYPRVRLVRWIASKGDSADDLDADE